MRTFSDATRHLARNSFFFGELDCTQGFPCKPMTDHWSVETLAINSLAESSTAKDLQKFCAYISVQFRASSWNNWNQLSKLTSVVKTWMMLGFKPIMLRLLSGSVGQYSSAFTRPNKKDNRKIQVQRLEFFCSTAWREGVSTQAQKITKLSFHQSNKGLHRYLGLLIVS